MCISSVGNFLRETEEVTNYIPIVSTITNLIYLFQKCVILPLMGQSRIAKSHHYTHIQDKNLLRCVILLIPILGNIIVGILSCFNKLQDGRNEDKNTVLASVQQDGMLLRHASKEQKNDRDIVLAAVSENGAALQYASKALQNDHAIVLAAVNDDGTALQYASPTLQDNSEIVWDALRENPLSLEHASPKCKDNTDMTLYCYQNCKSSVQYMTLRHNRPTLNLFLGLVKNELQGHGRTMAQQHAKDIENQQLLRTERRSQRSQEQCAQNLPRTDEDVATEPTSQQNIAVEEADLEGNDEAAPPTARENREAILDAMRRGGGSFENVAGRTFEHLAEPFRRDREIVLAAVRHYGPALEHTNAELRGDREIVLAAVGNDGRALKHASRELRSDREIVLAAVRHYGLALEYANAELRGDREIVFAAVERGGLALEYVSEELKGNREVVLAAVRNYGTALKYASAELRGDREIVFTAVLNSPIAIRSASTALQQECRNGPDDAFNAACRWRTEQRQLGRVV